MLLIRRSWAGSDNPKFEGVKPRHRPLHGGIKRKTGCGNHEGRRKLVNASSLLLRPPEGGKPGDKGEQEVDQTLQKLKSVLKTADWIKPTYLVDSTLTWLPQKLKTHLESLQFLIHKVDHVIKITRHNNKRDQRGVDPRNQEESLRWS